MFQKRTKKEQVPCLRIQSNRNKSKHKQATGNAQQPENIKNYKLFWINYRF